MSSGTFWGERKETFRISPSALLSPTCCFLLDTNPTLFKSLPGYFQIKNWMRMFQGEVAEMWLAVVLSGSAWIKVCWGWRVFEGLTDHRLCRHATAAALMPCLPLSLLASVGLLPLSTVLLKLAPEYIFYKKPFAFDSIFQWKVVFIKRSQPSCIQRLLL